MRFVRNSLILLALGANCAMLRAETFLDIVPAEIAAQPVEDASPLPSVVQGVGPVAPAAQPAQPAQLTQADNANLDGCQVIARIDDQIILACDVLWRVNQRIEAQKKKMGPDADIKPEQIEAVRQQLLRQEVTALVDRKLLFNEFRRNVPDEAWPRIEKNLEQPFNERELPNLMKQLNVDNPAALESKLAGLGSSMADCRRAFNEHAMASEIVRSKIKVNDDVSPDEMMAYYQAHLTDFDYPNQAKWEELAVRKDKFKDPAEAYAALAQLGNEVWQRGTAQPIKGAAFAEIAKVKSDGFTAKDGGTHDWTTKGALACKAIDQALFTLQVGQMSPIIDSGPTFHIVRVLERKEAGRQPYTEVQADIRDKLKDKRFQAEIEKYLTKLRADARIWTIFTGNVSAESLMSSRAEQSRQK